MNSSNSWRVSNMSSCPKLRIEGFTDVWEQRKFVETFDFLPNNSLSRAQLTYENGTVKNVHYGDVLIKFGELLDVGNEELPYLIDDSLIKNYSSAVLKNGDIVIADAAEDETVGKCSEIKGIKDEKILSGLHTIPVRPRVEFENGYLGYFMNSHSYHDQLLPLIQGTKVSSISKKVLENTVISYPASSSEQEKIAKFFESLTNLITLHQRELEKIISVRKAMIERMFPQGGSNVPAVRFGQYKQPWNFCRFSQIFKERHVVDTISKEYPQLAFTIEEGVIRPEDKKTNKRDFLIIDKATKKYLRTEYNDIIYNPANVIYGAIHRNSFGKGCVSPIYKIFYTDQDSSFMECIVRNPSFIKAISRSMEGTVKKLRTLKPESFLEMGAYIAPTIDEQRQIGEFFCQLDRLIELENKELEKIKHVKTACLEKMFV